MGKIINSIKVKDYSGLSPDEKIFFDEVLKNISPSENLRADTKIKPKESNFWYLKWKEIEALRIRLKDGNIEGVLELVYDISKEDLQEMQLTNVIGCFKWITEQMEKIAEAEKNVMGDSKPSQKEIDAGIMNFEKYGFYNSVKKLSPTILDENKVLELPYIQVFKRLSHENDSINYQEAINK